MRLEMQPQAIDNKKNSDELIEKSLPMFNNVLEKIGKNNTTPYNDMLELKNNYI